MDHVAAADPEPDWLAAAMRGDAAAFTRLYLRHAPQVHRFCARLLGPGAHADADDLTQDVFVTAWQRLGTFRGESAFGTWLLGIAARLTSNARRCRRWVPLRADLPAPAVGVGEPTDQADAVRRAIAALPPGAQAVLALRDLEGLSYVDVAAALGCSLAGVKTRLFRARTALRNELQRRGVG